MSLRDLIIVLGDQIDASSTAFDHFDPEQAAVSMAKEMHGSTVICSHKARIWMFTRARRHREVLSDGLRKFLSGLNLRGDVTGYMCLTIQTEMNSMHRCLHQTFIGPVKQR